MLDTDPITSRRKGWTKRSDSSIKLVRAWAPPEVGSGQDIVRDTWARDPQFNAPTQVDTPSPSPYAEAAAPSTLPPVPTQPVGSPPRADVPVGGSGAPPSRIPAQRPTGGTGGFSPQPDRWEPVQPGQTAFPASNDILRVAQGAIGSKYVWGGAGGRTSFDPNFVGSDCSGFVAWAYKNATGINLPAFTGSIYQVTKPISRDEARPGDIVMYNMGQGDPHEQHVGLYMGGNTMIHDSSINPNGGVQVTPLWSGAEFRRMPGVDTSQASLRQYRDPGLRTPPANPTDPTPPQDDRTFQWPKAPVVPKEWFSYVDKGREVLKVKWGDDQETFADIGEAEGDPGTVVQAGSLGMGSGQDEYDAGGGSYSMDDEQPWVIPAPAPQVSPFERHIAESQVGTPSDELTRPKIQEHPTTPPITPDMPQEPQPTVFDIPAVKEGFSAQTQPLRMASREAPPQRPIQPYTPPEGQPQLPAPEDPNANLTPIARQAAGMTVNPNEVKDEIVQRAGEAIIPKQIRNAPVLGGVAEMALDPGWLPGGVEQAGTEAAMHGGAAALKGGAAAVRHVVPEAAQMADHVLSPISKTAVGAIVKGLDKLQPGLGAAAAQRLPAYTNAQFASAMGLMVASGEATNLATDPNDPNRIAKIVTGTVAGAVSPYVVAHVTPSVVRAFNEFFAPAKNLPNHVQALVANLAGQEEGARMAGDLLEQRILDTLADKKLGFPKHGTGLDTADAHMLFEETKGFGPAMTPEQQQLADDLFHFGEITRKEGMRLGIINGDVTRYPNIKAYTPHMWEDHWTGPKGNRATATRRGLNPHDFFSDARDPNAPTIREKSKNLTHVDSVAQPWGMYARRYYSSKAKRQFVQALEKTGGPDVIMRRVKGSSTIPSDWVSGAKWHVPGLDQFSVSPDMAHVLDNLYNPSGLRKFSAVNGFMNAFAEAKKALFAPSGFHLANELRQVFSANGKEGVPVFAKSLYYTLNPWGYRRFVLDNAKLFQQAADSGVTLLRGHNQPDVGMFGMGKLGGTAVRAGFGGATTGGSAYLQSKRDLDPDQVALQKGLQGAGLGAALGVAGGPIADALWNRAVPTMKIMSWQILKDRYGEKPAAEFVNEVFGGQNLEAIARSKTVQDLLRITALAPDWQEGWIRQIGNALRPSASHPLAQANRWYWLNAGVTSAFMLEGLNLAMNGHFTNENGPNNQLRLEMTGLYDRQGWSHRDDQGRPFRVYADILGPYRGMIESPIDPGKFLAARAGMGPSAGAEILSGKDYTGKDIVAPGEDPLKNAALRVGHLLSRLAPVSGEQYVQSKGKDPFGIELASAATGARLTHQSPIAEQLTQRDKALTDLGLTPERQQQALETYTNLLTLADRQFEETISKPNLTHQQIDTELQKVQHPDRPTIDAASLPPNIMADPAKTAEIRKVIQQYANFGTSDSQEPADIQPENNVNMDDVYSKFWTPQAGMETMTPAEQNSVRNKALAQMAQQYGVDVNTLRDAVKAKDRGFGTPAAVPGVTSAAIDDWVSQWASKTSDDPMQQSADRRAVIDQIAQQYNISPDTVWQRIKLRRIPAQKPNDLENSRNKALDILFAAHDPNRYPKYRDQNGQAMGGPDQWKQFDAQVAQASTHDRQRPDIKAMIEAKQRADAYQRKSILGSPDYPEYERWFGIGRAMTEAQWAKYQQGGYPHYTDTKDPVETLNRDHLSQQYKASTPEERRNTVVDIIVSGQQEHLPLEAAYRYLSNPRVVQKGWSKALGLDETGSAPVSSTGGP